MEQEEKPSRPWREIAEEASTEKNSKRLNELAKQLVAALEDEEAQKKKRHSG
jgi:hypothetical protein